MQTNRIVRNYIILFMYSVLPSLRYIIALDINMWETDDYQTDCEGKRKLGVRTQNKN